MILLPWQEGIGELSESNREETMTMEMQLLCVFVCLSITLFSLLFSLAAELYFMCWLSTVRKMVHPVNSKPKNI